MPEYFDLHCHFYIESLSVAAVRD